MNDAFLLTVLPEVTLRYSLTYPIEKIVIKVDLYFSDASFGGLGIIVEVDACDFITFGVVHDDDV